YGTSGGLQARILEIDPAPGPATLLAMGPASQDLIGGNSGRASVALVIPAPAGGGTVSLTTDNPSVIHVPASVTIPAGNSATSFTITTFAVGNNTLVTITAFFDTTTSANLTVTSGAPPPSPTPPASPTPPSSPTPPASPTPGLGAPSLISPAVDARFAPGTNITFDWSNVAGATSYTIQIDDQDSFSSPLILNQTVTPSQLSTSTLPTLRMWWRVRANNGGSSGPWSAVRRFEIRN